MTLESSKRISPFWKGVAAGVGGMLLLLAVVTAVMHYGMDECPFCGQSMKENQAPVTHPENVGTE